MWSICLKIVTDYYNGGSCILFNDQITCNDDVKMWYLIYDSAP